MIHKEPLFDSKVTSVKISSDNNYILASSLDGSCIKYFDLRLNMVMLTLMDDGFMNSYETN